MVADVRNQAPKINNVVQHNYLEIASSPVNMMEVHVSLCLNSLLLVEVCQKAVTQVSTIHLFSDEYLKRC